MTAIGIRIAVQRRAVAREPEGRARRQAADVDGSAARPPRPTARARLQRYDSRQIGGQNMARFRLPAFDALYDRMQALPDGPERDGAVPRGQAHRASPTCRTSTR